MQSAMPLGDTTTPFCEGEYLPRTMGRGSLFILNNHSCCIESVLLREEEVADSHFVIVGFEGVAERNLPPISRIDDNLIQTHIILLSLDSERG